jgi:polar amino acid transport system permease protein
MRATASRSLRTSARREFLVRSGVTLAMFAGFVGVVSLAVYRWEWSRIWGPGGPWPLLLRGLATTAWISAVALVLGLGFGILGGLARLSRRPAVHQAGTVYVEVFRGTPFIVQLMVAYFCIAPALAGGLERIGAPAGLVDFVQSAVPVGVVALGVFAGAYVTEIFRSAVQSIDPGQTEAALSQGMSRGQVLRWILLPQALRRMVPPVTGELVSLVKDSSLLSIIGVMELRKSADVIYTSTYKTFEAFLPLALLYLAITFPLSRLARRLELRLA